MSFFLCDLGFGHGFIYQKINDFGYDLVRYRKRFNAKRLPGAPSARFGILLFLAVF